MNGVLQNGKEGCIWHFSSTKKFVLTCIAHVANIPNFLNGRIRVTSVWKTRQMSILTNLYISKKGMTMEQDNRDLQKYKSNVIARAIGYILGYLFAIMLFVAIQFALVFGIIAAMTYAIFWCFGWEWNIFIPLGIYLLSILIRLLFHQKRS